MNKRSYFQNFVDGNEDTQDVFIMENAKTQCIGVEVDGFIATPAKTPLLLIFAKIGLILSVAS